MAASKTLITLHENIPSTSTQISREKFVKVIAGYLPDHWMLEFDKESPHSGMRLIFPEKREIHIGAERSYATALLIASNLKRCVKLH